MCVAVPSLAVLVAVAVAVAASPVAAAFVKVVFVEVVLVLVEVVFVKVVVVVFVFFILLLVVAGGVTVRVLVPSGPCTTLRLSFVDLPRETTRQPPLSAWTARPWVVEALHSLRGATSWAATVANNSGDPHTATRRTEQPILATAAASF